MEEEKEKKPEKRQNTWQELKKTFKFFWKAFKTIIRRGVIQHKRGLTIGAGIFFLFMVAFSIGMYKFSETAFFCGSCHHMEEYVASWKTSTHKDVGCIDCHYKPGIINHLKGKWRDGQVSLIYVISGKTPPRAHAQVDDESCLQSKCHSKAELDTPIVFKNVVFNHSNHLKELKREKKLRCTTCHSQIVQGTHMVVTDVECFICHFYKEKGQKELPAFSKCTACHFEAKGEIKIGDFYFNHKNYMKRGIACEKCHTNMIEGDGRIKENTCLQCHDKKQVIEAKYTPEYLHRIHVTDYKVECFACHSVIKHETKKLHYRSADQSECVQCHRPEDHHDSVVNMYIGKGAKFVEDTPNRKATLNMDCTMCHDASRDKSQIAAKCSGCHGNFTDSMVGRWNKLVRENQAELLKDIQLTKEVIAGKKLESKLKKKIDEAMYNYAFIENGHGAHNIIYTMKIIETTRNVLREVRAKVTGETIVVKPFKLSCTTLCHGNINQRKIAFGTVNFPHEPHAENDEACTTCHSKYDNHGKTTMKGCSSCHHGEGIGKVTCQDCHKSEVAMFMGTGVAGVQGIKSPLQKKADCISCHSGIKKTGKHDLSSIKASCKNCHKKDYSGTVNEWAKKNKELKEKYTAELAAIEKDIDAIESAEGKHFVPLRTLFEELDEEVKFLTLGGFNHNHLYSAAIAEKIDKNLERLKKMIKDKKAGKKIKLI